MFRAFWVFLILTTLAFAADESGKNSSWWDQGPKYASKQAVPSAPASSPKAVTPAPPVASEVPRPKQQTTVISKVVAARPPKKVAAFRRPGPPQAPPHSVIDEPALPDGPNGQWLGSSLEAPWLTAALEIPAPATDSASEAPPEPIDAEREEEAAAPAEGTSSASAPSPLSEDLPNWLRFGLELRGRAERQTGIDLLPGKDDGLYLHRVRFSTALALRPWVRLFAQVQDAQAPGASLEPVPSTSANTLDLQQAFVEFGGGQSTWGLRGGRQELSFGEERLVGAGDWLNSGQTFDAARLSYRTEGVNLDWFASSVVVPENGNFDRHRDGNNLYGFYGSFSDVLPRGTFEPYMFWKTNSDARDGLGRNGDLDIFTYGARVAAKFRSAFDYKVEMAVQSGHVVNGDHSAWAGHWQAGYTLGDGRAATRLVGEYNFASGSSNPGGEASRTFDQLFSNNHGKYGFADRVGWRNMRDAMLGAEWKPFRRWKINVDYHSLWLANTADALYGVDGKALVHNPTASSGHIGHGIDIQSVYAYSKAIQIGAGYSHLFAGDYLKQSGRIGASYPYLMWKYRF